jgi:hypothetical protein
MVAKRASVATTKIGMQNKSEMICLAICDSQLLARSADPMNHAGQ